MLQTVTGNTAGRDLNVAGRDNVFTAYLTGLRHIRPRPVNAHKEIPTDLFVEPPFFDSAIRAMNPPTAGTAVARVVALRAPEASGRRSSALRLLASTPIPDGRIFELLPDWDEPDVASLPQERSSGYLLNLRGVTQALPDQFYNDLVSHSSRLNEIDSYLVIAVSPTAWKRTWFDGIRHGVFVADIGLPSSIDIVKKYLRSKPETSHRESWIDDEGSSFYGLLPESSSPSEAIRLAEIIAQANGPNDEERLDEYHGWQDRIGQWFSGGSEGVELRAIRIAGAILNGAPASVVLDSADLLLRTPEIDFPIERGGLLARPDARSRLKPAGISFDPITGAARLIHDSQGPAILQYIWREHTQLSHVLIRWLQDVSQGPAHANIDILVSSLTRLAGLIGVEPILKLAESWLHKESNLSVQAVGSLMSELTLDSVLGGRVRIELGKWASGKSNPNRQLAAAYALQGVFGRNYPSQALTRARYLFVSGTAQAKKEAVKAIKILASTPDLTARTVDTIVKWITPTEDRTPVDASLFLTIFSPEIGSESDPRPLQVALNQGGQAGQAIQKRLLEGWLQVIRRKSHQVDEDNALLRWRQAAENDQLPQDAVVNMIIQLIRNIGILEPTVRNAIRPDGKLKDVLLDTALVGMQQDFDHSLEREADSATNYYAEQVPEVATDSDDLTS